MGRYLPASPAQTVPGDYRTNPAISSTLSWFLHCIFGPPLLVHAILSELMHEFSLRCQVVVDVMEDKPAKLRVPLESPIGEGIAVIFS
jgi:hypothetical protein